MRHRAASLLFVLLAGCGGESPAPAGEGATETVLTEAELARQGPDALDRLGDIGYSQGEHEAGDEVGVTIWDRRYAEEGLNFYVSAHGAEALLMDMAGRTVHRWTADFWTLFPGQKGIAKNDVNTRYFRRAYLQPDGSVLAIFEGLGLVKLDHESQVVWARPNQAHHDLEVAANGDIWVLTRKWAQVDTPEGKKEPTLFDFVSVLDANGETKREVSVLKCITSSPFAGIWQASPIKTGDILHTNTLEILDGSLADDVPAFARGRVLTSMRNISTLAVLDLATEKVVWAHQGSYRHQHDPHVLPNKNLLLFDNLGAHPYSRVLELDPATMESVWTYAGNAATPFYSFRCGVAQRLANGNTLITESSQGRAFEVLPDGAIVWEFKNPGRVGANDELVARLFELKRVDPAFTRSWLED